MENKILNAITIIAAGGIVAKVIKTARDRKIEKELYDTEVVYDEQSDKE